MQRTIRVKQMQYNLPNVGAVDLDRPPDRCPLCHHGIQPLDVGQAIGAGNFVEKVFRCPRSECGRFFITRYLIGRGHAGEVTGRLSESVPFTMNKSEHSDTIKNVSPDFVAIYDEAEAAEKSGLKLVCGPGYRKALEFLIKDYVIRSHQDKEDEIKNLNLARCIADYVPDGRVKQVSARAVWLGNDETHYLRKWEGKDLSDLKALINLTVHWIEMDELTQQALKDMPEGK